jgi:hypothetical protein
MEENALSDQVFEINRILLDRTGRKPGSGQNKTKIAEFELLPPTPYDCRLLVEVDLSRESLFSSSG